MHQSSRKLPVFMSGWIRGKWEDEWNKMQLKIKYQIKERDHTDYCI
ncbi:hypothetical protein A2U01_0043288, partial [Trifolium medium]|nr:hypothetical protein [Trifolium medium]